MRMPDPFPDRPEDADRQRLHVPRGNVDQQILNLPAGDRFEMIDDRFEVPTPDEGRGRLEDGPGLADEVNQPLLGTLLLRLLPLVLSVVARRVHSTWP